MEPVFGDRTEVELNQATIALGSPHLVYSQTAKPWARWRCNWWTTAGGGRCVSAPTVFHKYTITNQPGLICSYMVYYLDFFTSC
jgi:hypothetical protein